MRISPTNIYGSLCLSDHVFTLAIALIHESLNAGFMFISLMKLLHYLAKIIYVSTMEPRILTNLGLSPYLLISSCIRTF